MAKKKSKTTQKKTAVINNRSKTSMVSKVEVKEPKENFLSRIIGTLFICLGLILIFYGIFSFIRNNRSPYVNDAFTSPTLSGTPTVVNGDSIIVKGQAEGYRNVEVYLDNEPVGKAKVNKDGFYEFSKKIEDEGRYILSVAGLKGFFKRSVSPKSDPVVVKVDRTAPELTKLDYSKEVGTQTFGIVGEAEPGSKILLKRGTDLYEAIADINGKFQLKDISLEDGTNVYALAVKDEAGNINEIEEKVSVIYSKDSAVNGNAVTDSNLPVAAGELDIALSVMRDGRIMSLFGIMALLAFITTSGVILLKKRQID